MTQLDLIDAPQMPPAETQCAALLEQLQHGARYTVASALIELRIYALSQRVGELRRMGWHIRDRFVETEGGTRVKEYWLCDKQRA